MRVLEGLLILLGALLGLPLIVLLGEVTAACLPRRAKMPEPAGPCPPFVVLVPAHDEAGQIAETVSHLAGHLRSGDRLIVIADNCSDDTAARARNAGATVVERTDSDRRGKGFAIAFGLRYLDADPPEVVVLVDADCRLNGDISRLAGIAKSTGRPVQAEYLLQAPPQSSPTTVLSSLAVLVRNQVRPRGLDRLGLPCHLTGSGMAFPWRILRDSPETGDNLVEDLVMGIEMTLADHPPLLCPTIQVSSELPSGAAAGNKQRRRWEHGQLHTLVVYTPRLIGTGLRTGRVSIIALGLDLLVPPLALLAIMEGTFASISFVAWATGLAGEAPALLGLANVAMLVTSVGLAWACFARKTIPMRYLFLVPVYIVRKIPLYLSLFLRGRQKSWERTARPGEDPRRSGPGTDP